MGRKVMVVLCGALPAMAAAWVVGGKERVPVSTGAYEVHLGGQRIGEEQFRMFKDKKRVVESTSTIYWPEPIRYEYRYELGDSYRIEKLTGSMTRSGLVTELKLEPRGDNWQLEIKGKGRKKVNQELGSRDSSEIDFGSLLFSSFIVRRLSLHPGEQRQVDVIVWQLPDFMGRRAQHTYRRLEDEDIEVKALGTVHASAYELVVEESSHQVWFDSSGVAVRARFELPSGTFEHELVRLKSELGVW